MTRDNYIKIKLNETVDRWGLIEVKAIYEHEHKAVYAAVSPQYGPVILKLNQETNQLCEEYTMLYRLNGRGCCKVHEYDKESGILLEERLLPGTVLREEESLSKRIEVFKTVFSQIHCREVGQVSCQESEAKAAPAPIYTDWLRDVYRFCMENDVDAKLTERARLARDICAEMFEKYPERMLLHGDLHHDNILLREDGSYAMIDPKGVIGPEILDIPRYIMNEIDTKHISSDEEHMREVVRLMSDSLHYPPEDVAKLYFMEVILGNIWCLEDGEEINAEEIIIAEKILNDYAINIYT